MSDYDQSRADFEYLEAINALEDQVELDAQRLGLMRNPTKNFAAKMYQDGIGLWFVENADKSAHYPEAVKQISRRYSIETSDQS